MLGFVQGERTVFFSLFMHRRTEVALPEPTKAFLKLSSEMAMLSAPTHFHLPTLSAHAELISIRHRKLIASFWVYLATSGKELISVACFVVVLR